MRRGCNWTPHELLCLGYSVGRAQSWFFTILHLRYTSSHPTSTQYSAFYTVEPHCAHTYAHTYAHTAKHCLDPPRAPMFRAQCREGVVQFTHAPHTATSTRAITPTKNICAASSTYQIPRYTCVLNIRRHMHTHASMPVYIKLHHFHCERSRSFIARVRKVSLRAWSSIFETLVQAHPEVQLCLSMLVVKLCGRSGASSTLAPKL